MNWPVRVKWKDIRRAYMLITEIDEPATSPGHANSGGWDAIKRKGRNSGEMVETMHGGKPTAPIGAGNHFALAMGLDGTMQGMGRMKRDEIAV